MRSPFKTAKKAIALYTVLFLLGASGTNAGESVAIGTVQANPSAYHLRAVTLHGKAQNVITYEPYTVNQGFQKTFCPQKFTLVDETGSIEVHYIPICEHGGQPATLEVKDGDGLLVEAVVHGPGTYYSGVTVEHRSSSLVVVSRISLSGS